MRIAKVGKRIGFVARILRVFSFGKSTKLVDNIEGEIGVKNRMILQPKKQGKKRILFIGWIPWILIGILAHIIYNHWQIIHPK